VRLGGSVLALVRLENGREISTRLHQLSITGGLLHFPTPLDEGIKVELIFHLGSTAVQGRVQMLFPMWATSGVLQPFRFTDLAEQDRKSLESDLHSLLGTPKAAAARA
jgi:hypothetical protein